MLVCFVKFKLNPFHNSIVEPHELFKELQLINNHPNNEKQLPFEATLQKILIFEKIININSYIKNNQIVFVVKIPLVEKNNYNYYHTFTHYPQSKMANSV